MKKNIFITLFLILCLGLFAQQQLPNPGFENWDEVFMYEGLSVWNNSNSGNFQGNAGITKSDDAYSGNYSVKLQSLLYEEDTAFSYFYHGLMSGDGPGGGIPYTEDFDGISGYYKSDMAEYDSAVVLVIKYYESTPTWFFGKLGGVNEDWTYFHFELPPVECDSVFVGCVSGDIFTEYVYSFESWIMFDSIYFTNSGGDDPNAELIPNHDFEDWQDHYCTNLNSWYSLNNYFSSIGVEPLKKTEDAYAGNYAVELETNLIMEAYMIPGYLSIGEIYLDDDNPVRKIPYTDKPTKITGYYKYFTETEDNGVAQINFTALGETIGGGSYVFPEAEEYTYFETPIEFVADPDSLLLVFSSGGNEGSRLILDNVSFENFVNTQTEQAAVINIYPNPASEYILISVPDLLLNENITITDIQGRVIKEIYSIKENPVKIDVSDVCDGVYFINCQQSGLFKKIIISR
ncbi:MAG TPA: T9SS type A sorting domain-containing protein [Bacteroidales bacterium]|nr:T9SS type A sorting domain-containing protein [Bacteroidales bacterium]